MLPLWPESERLILGDKHLTLHSRGKTHSVALPVERSGQVDFQALMTSLPTAFNKLAGHKLTISLSNSRVRYFVIPWRPHLYAHKDWLALAHNHFHEQFGGKAADWDIQISLQGYQQSVLAIATERQLVEGLDKLAEANKWQLLSTEPAFVTLVNRFPRYWRGNSWLMMAEPERILLAESHNGVWLRISYMQTSPELVESHALMLLEQARQLTSHSHKLRLFLHRHGAVPKQTFTDALDVRVLSAEWLSERDAGGQL